MRIITGTARGTRLETLEGEDTRPTPEMVKEAVFSMIQFEIEGRKFFDVYGGSGQMGLEALSRGADSALFCDSNREAVEIIKRNAQKTKLFTKCRVLCSDSKTMIRQLAGREKFDIFYIDPPYAEQATGDILDRIHRAGLANDGAILICETDQKEPVEAEGYSITKHTKYGRSYITVYTPAASEEIAE